jgi:hypothetical protein
MQDYDTLSMEQLVDELQILVNNDKVMSVKDHVEEIKKAFLAQYNHFIEEKRRIKLKTLIRQKIFNTNSIKSLTSPTRSTRTIKYTFQSLQTNLKSNLENRLAIVEELKELINPQENIKDTLKHFNELRDRWKNRDQYQR